MTGAQESRGQANTPALHTNAQGTLGGGLLDESRIPGVSFHSQNTNIQFCSQIIRGQNKLSLHSAISLKSSLSLLLSALL